MKNGGNPSCGFSFFIFHSNSMSLATIIKKINDEAEAQSQQIIDRANAEAEKILEHGRKKAEEEAVQIIRHAEEELENLKNKRMATTLLHMRKEKLDHRQQILSEVFKKALSRIQSYDIDQYQEGARQLLMAIGEEKQGSILLSRADKSFIDESFVDKINAELQEQKRKLRFKLSNKLAQVERGFIVDFRDFEVNYSIEVILSDLWTKIEGDVSDRLFEDESIKEE
jgi:V/A-type H+-transporting ATPase subunit E